MSHRQQPRRRARTRSRQRPSPILSRPDRIALWAVLIALGAMFAAAASSAHGSTGGLSPAAGEPDAAGEPEGQCAPANFGQRELQLGDCGPDVRTLNWILNSKRFGRSAPLRARFVDGTEGAVRRFQSRNDLPADGVVDRPTRRVIVRSMRKARATWYGPGFYGNRTACGQTLRKRTVGVAHRRLPCGTRVAIRYRGRFIRTRVIDRGPYAHGARWDLTNGAAKRLGFSGTNTIHAAPIRRARR